MQMHLGILHLAVQTQWKMLSWYLNKPNKIVAVLVVVLTEEAQEEAQAARKFKKEFLPTGILFFNSHYFQKYIPNYL